MRVATVSHELNVNDLLAGRYELLELAGEGGMAEIWRGRLHGAAGFHRPVAIKRILPQQLSDETASWFIEEARVVSLLFHPNIVQILDFDRAADGSFFMVMEWVDGLDLRQYVSSFMRRGQRTPWPLVSAVVIEALWGLDAAHSRLDDRGEPAPVIHRDVTLGNILLSSIGAAKLTDFGLSRAMDRASWTVPHMVKGKISYTAPEIFHDQDWTVRSDLYSMGVVLWEALAGRKLYMGKTEAEIFLAASQAEVPPMNEQRDDLPDQLLQMLELALAREPSRRYPSALVMLRELCDILRHQPMTTDARAIAESLAGARKALGESEPG